MEARTKTLRILLANEPRAYREAIAGTLKQLRPQTELFVIEPELLDSEVLRLRPDVVVCNSVSVVVQNNVLSWVKLYPNGEALSVVSIARHRSTMGDPQLGDLLSVMDHTEQLHQPR